MIWVDQIKDTRRGQRLPGGPVVEEMGKEDMNARVSFSRGGRTSLVVQWLRLHAFNAGDPGSIPGQGTRSHMLQLSPSTAK